MHNTVMIIMNDGEIKTYKSQDEFRRDNVDQIRICAKKSGGSCYVLGTKSGDLFDPTDSACNRLAKDFSGSKLKYCMVRCATKTFNYYCRFLRTKHRSDWHLAQRSFLND